MIDGDNMDLTHLMPEENGTAMDDLEIQAHLTGAIEEAVMHFEEHIEPDMAKATDYYYGRPFGDEKAGRSQVVSTDLRDATLDQIPDLIEIFMGSDSVVEFKPRGPEDEETAKQATDYVNYIFFEDNDGFLILNSVLKDAAVRRAGYVKWWWEDQVRTTGATLSGLTDQHLQVLAQEPGVEFEIVAQEDRLMPQQDPQTGEQTMVPVPHYTVDVTRNEPYGCVRVEEVPPEEVVWTPEARKFSRSPLVAHTREVPRDELILMGIPEAFIDEHRGERSDRSTESLAWARQFYGSSSVSEMVRDSRDDRYRDASQEMVLFTEAYAVIDTDGDGIGELRMFRCVGSSYEIVPNEDGSIVGELVDEVPIAVFTPDPEPHTILGLCNYDYLKEVQRVKSQIQRGQLNSLAQSIEHQMVVSSSDVNMKDLIDPEISGLIRVRRDVNNSIREIRHQFVGGDTLPVLEYYDQIRRDRTGRPGPNEGMDANILQSTTAEGVGSVLSKAQQRLRMLARVYSETGFKAVFRGIYGLVVKHQNHQRMIRLRGEMTPIDPRYWDSSMDVRVNVALGTGSKTERIQALQALAEKQEMHLQMGSPLVSFAELRNTYGKLTDLLGYKNTDQFFKPWGQQEQQQLEQQQAQAAEEEKKNPSDPAILVAQVEQLKVQLQAQEAQQKMQLESLKLELEDSRERDKMAKEFALREFEIEMQYKGKIDDAEIKAKTAMNRKEPA